MLGDFVRGPVTNEWPGAVGLGIKHHRRIDVVTDAHPLWRRSRDRFPQNSRRFAGIAVDVCYDHFLARDWHTYHGTPLHQFTALAYQDIGTHEALFPKRLAKVFGHMVSQDWLASYADFDNVVFALTRMSKRSAKTGPLADAALSARDIYTELSGDFDSFFPALVTQAGEQRRDLMAQLNSG